MQFNLVICGLDSVEARRWINATLVHLVDPDIPESLKPLIDGGTEGSFCAWHGILVLTLGDARLQGPSSRNLADH
jgi:molybdopterin/thiamine biosynthesis adenylyltransferase